MSIDPLNENKMSLIVLGTQSDIKVACVKRFFGDQISASLKCIKTMTDFVQPLGASQGKIILIDLIL